MEVKVTIKTATPCIGPQTTTDENFQQVICLIAKHPVRLGRWLLEDLPRGSAAGSGFVVTRWPEKYRASGIPMEHGATDTALMHRSASLCVAAGYMIGAWLGDWT